VFPFAGRVDPPRAPQSHGSTDDNRVPASSLPGIIMKSPLKSMESSEVCDRPGHCSNATPKTARFLLVWSVIF
jgi:hypothetical protein